MQTASSHLVGGLASTTLDVTTSMHPVHRPPYLIASLVRTTFFWWATHPLAKQFPYGQRQNESHDPLRDLMLVILRDTGAPAATLRDQGKGLQEGILLPECLASLLVLGTSQLLQGLQTADYAALRKQY